MLTYHCHLSTIHGIILGHHWRSFYLTLHAVYDPQTESKMLSCPRTAFTLKHQAEQKKKTLFFLRTVGSQMVIFWKHCPTMKMQIVFYIFCTNYSMYTIYYSMRKQAISIVLHHLKTSSFLKTCHKPQQNQNKISPCWCWSFHSNFSSQYNKPCPYSLCISFRLEASPTFV